MLGHVRYMSLSVDEVTPPDPSHSVSSEMTSIARLYSHSYCPDTTHTMVTLATMSLSASLQITREMIRCTQLLTVIYRFCRVDVVCLS